MSVRDTLILKKSDLRYLLIDSLRLYSTDVHFIDGNNPYRFTINKKEFYVLIKNVHESGYGRSNSDECRVQISRTPEFGRALSSRSDVVVLGYFADERVFTAWNPYIMQPRFNQRSTISLYSRFSVMTRAAGNGIACYVDTNNQRVITFKPEYLGLYLDNITNVHTLDESELKDLVAASDRLQLVDGEESVDIGGRKMQVLHVRTARDPRFRKLVYEAYKHRCAMCGIQLELIEAAHIIPHSHAKGSDEVHNGICLCSLHHAAYDQSLVFFDVDYNVHMNDEKFKYLEKLGYDGGYRKLASLGFDKIQVPINHSARPKPENILIANQIRGIPVKDL